MTTKAERNKNAYDQITTILTATGRPMLAEEIGAHALFRPLNATNRSLGQWLKYLVKAGLVSRKGRSSRTAQFALAVPKERKAKAATGDSVIIRLAKDGVIRSIRAPAGIEVELELVA